MFIKLYGVHVSIIKVYSIRQRSHLRGSDSRHYSHVSTSACQLAAYLTHLFRMLFCQSHVVNG